MGAGALLRPEEVAEILGLSPATLAWGDPLAGDRPSLSAAAHFDIGKKI